MSLFLDASAIVAMLGREPEAVPFGRRVEWESDRLTSAIAIWEATRGLANARDLAIEEAQAIVADYVRDFRVRVVPIGIEKAELAFEAHRRFGKGRHDAKLNLRDCFAYACTMRHDAELLFKGDDFIHTDVKDAMLS